MILKNASKFFSGTLLSRLLGFTRDLTMAWAFGATPLTAALLIAFRLINLPRRLLGEGAMQAAFVPLYQSLEPQRAARLLSHLRLALTLFTTTLVLLLEAILWPLDGQIAHFVRILLPAIPFICLYGVNLAALSTQGRFFLPASAPALFNLTWIAFALTRNLDLVALSIVLGSIAQWLTTHRRAPTTKGPSDLPRLIKPLLLSLLAVGATQIGSALDAIFARIADPSGPAYLWYAIRLYQLPMGLFAIALSTALLPALKSNPHLLSKARTYALTLMIPASLGLILLAKPIITLLFSHGAFTATTSTAACLQAYALGLVPATLALLQSQTYFAAKDYRTPARASALALLTNAGLNTLFIFGFHLGAVSVALATSIGSAIQYFYLRGVGQELADRLN